MSISLKSLLLSSVAALLLAVPAFSQISQVEGIVKDEKGQPIKDALVIFERTDIKGKYQVKSDKKGHYGHYGLPLGTYNISVTVDGKVRDQMNSVRTSLGDAKQINFDLKQSADQAQALQKAAETGTLTQEQSRGMTKEQKEAFDKAAKAREAQIAKNKELNDAYTAGKTALEAKQYDAAIENLTKATTLDPKQSAVWTSLADAYAGLAPSKGAEMAATYEKAFDAYKKALEIVPDDAGLYNNYALALAKAKKIDDAKANLAKAAQLDPAGAGKYWYNLGALLVNSGQNAAAEEEFRHAVTADPNYADAQFQLGMALAAKANTDPASGKITPAPGTVEALQKYLELKPDGANAEQAKEMIAMLGSTVSTSFGNPSAATKGKAAPKGKK